MPLTSREDTDFFSHLEMHLRQENPPLAGRDHMAYRSYYFPVKDVLDGDLCEQYTQVSGFCAWHLCTCSSLAFHAGQMLSRDTHGVCLCRSHLTSRRQLQRSWIATLARC